MKNYDLPYDKMSSQMTSFKLMTNSGVIVTGGIVTEAL
tara:strand:- start:177 stop:290 length:114 start_codon:yes stop_codon:yes gene_type:complete